MHFIIIFTTSLLLPYVHRYVIKHSPLYAEPEWKMEFISSTVHFFIRKPSLSFKPNSQILISNSAFEPYCQTLNFQDPDSKPRSQTHSHALLSWNKLRRSDLWWYRFNTPTRQDYSGRCEMTSRTLIPKQGRSWFKVRWFQDRVAILGCGLCKCCRCFCRKANAAFLFAESPSLLQCSPSPHATTPFSL